MNAELEHREDPLGPTMVVFDLEGIEPRGEHGGRALVRANPAVPSLWYTAA